jgi:predicted alpha/beta-hydrolase family hydrolase
MNKPSETSPWGAAGDIVAIYELLNQGPARVELRRISRVTATQVVVDRSHGLPLRFRRDDGRLLGDYYGQRLKSPESREVQDALAAHTILGLGNPLGAALKGVRNRTDALKALHELNRIVLETADELGVNRADLR